MDELKFRLESARQALLTLEEVLREPPGVLVRDATVKRFEYSFEADRTTHTYRLAVAQALLGRVRSYFDVMSRLTDRIAGRVGPQA